jgi:hypothetical protein
LVKRSIRPKRRIAMRVTFMRIAAATVTALATASPALAAAATTDNKGILVWSVLGFCALIIAIIPDERNHRCDEIAKGLSTKAEANN